MKKLPIHLGTFFRDNGFCVEIARLIIKRYFRLINRYRIAFNAWVNITYQRPVPDALAGSEDKREQECYN